jgi:hypothetical protein
VSPWVVIVAEAFAGAVTLAGLTVHTGGSTVDCVVDVTMQPRFTVPVKLSAPTVMFEDDDPPGATASGESGAAARVNVWADADEGKARKVAKKHKTAIPVAWLRNLSIDSDDSDFDG